MYKLLIADDEKIIRESVSEIIDWDKIGIQVTACCKNGYEALDAIMDTAPDIVMTDICMPGLDGLELINKMRVLDSHIQFIILTGYPEFEYAQRAVKYGVREYLLKPISEEQIIDAVDKARRLLPVYDNPAVSRLVQNLLQARKEGDKEKAVNNLKYFYSRFCSIDKLRSLGINLLMELHTGLGLILSESLTNYTDKLILEQDFIKLCDCITKQTVDLLFAVQDTAVSISDLVKNLVHQHLDDENLSLKYIAENHLFINVNYLSRVFTKQTGEKFSGYLSRLRVEKAKKLLNYSKSSNIYDIAEAVGFGNNPQYFSQVFKKYSGLTPSQYMKE